MDKPSGTSWRLPLAPLFSRFQLPRMDKPSGTQDRGNRQPLGAVVSTSPGTRARPSGSGSARVSVSSTLASAPPSVQFGELKAPPEAVGAERRRSLSWEQVERAEDGASTLAQISSMVPLPFTFLTSLVPDTFNGCPNDGASISQGLNCISNNGRNPRLEGPL